VKAEVACEEVARRSYHPTTSERIKPVGGVNMAQDFRKVPQA